MIADLDSQDEITLKEALRIIEEARRQGVLLKLLGGIAFRLRCPSSLRSKLRRHYVDIDFVGVEKQRQKIRELFSQLGYEPRTVFNALVYDRMIFEDVKSRRRIDVFLEVLRMSHKLKFKDRLELDELTLPLADLMLTKLQAYEFTEREYKDVLALLWDYDLTNEDSKDGINVTYLAKLCSDDWGLYKTVSLNLERLQQAVPFYFSNLEEQSIILDKIKQMQKTLESSSKSFRWKTRAAIGTRIKWYETPEEDKVSSPDGTQVL